MSEAEEFAGLVSVLLEAGLVQASEAARLQLEKIPRELWGTATALDAVPDHALDSAWFWWCDALAPKWAFGFSLDDMAPTNIDREVVLQVKPVLDELGVSVVVEWNRETPVEVTELEYPPEGVFWLNDVPIVVPNPELVTSMRSLAVCNDLLAEAGADRRFCFRGKQWSGPVPYQSFCVENWIYVDLLSLRAIEALVESPFIIEQCRPILIESVTDLNTFS